MSRETPAAPSEQFCWRCGHEPHDERSDPRCGEIVGGGDQPMPEPVYCGCVDADALYVRAIRAERFIGGISPDEWATIDKARAALRLAARPALDVPTLAQAIHAARHDGTVRFENCSAGGLDHTLAERSAAEYDRLAREQVR